MDTEAQLGVIKATSKTSRKVVAVSTLIFVLSPVCRPDLNPYKSYSDHIKPCNLASSIERTKSHLRIVVQQ